jgi:hypothetical protein
MPPPNGYSMPCEVGDKEISAVREMIKGFSLLVLKFSGQ